MYHEAGFRAARRLVRVPMHSARGRAILLRLEAAEEREAAALPLPPGLEILAGPAKRGVFMLDGDEVAGEERLSLGARIRDVRQGPDGAVYALTDEDNGRLLRLTRPLARTEGSRRQ